MEDRAAIIARGARMGKGAGTISLGILAADWICSVVVAVPKLVAVTVLGNIDLVFLLVGMEGQDIHCIWCHRLHQKRRAARSTLSHGKGPA